MPETLKLSEQDRTVSTTDLIRQYFPRRKADYIFAIFSETELEVVRNSPQFETEDFLLHAKARRISSNKEKFARYQTAELLDFHHACMRNIEWMKQELYLIGMKKGSEPNTSELTNDFELHHNGEHLRVFYCLKHPERIRFR